MNKNFAIILAGGIGQRMGGIKLPKQFLEIEGTPIIILTLKKIIHSNLFDFICIAIHQDWFEYLEELLQNYSIDLEKIKIIRGGGKSNWKY